jgi:hypothetical protein
MSDRYKYYEALEKITTLDPGLWQTMQDIANEALGKQPRWRGKKKTPAGGAKHVDISPTSDKRTESTSRVET